MHYNVVSESESEVLNMKQIEIATIKIIPPFTKLVTTHLVEDGKDVAFLGRYEIGCDEASESELMETLKAKAASMFPEEEKEEPEEIPEIKFADYEYTGGGIYVFFGELADGTFFMTDGYEYDTRIVNEDPTKVEDGGAWYAEWQEEHLVRDIDTEKQGPSFMLKVIEWLRKNNEYANKDADIDYIEEDAKQYVGKTGWR